MNFCNTGSVSGPSQHSSGTGFNRQAARADGSSQMSRESWTDRNSNRVSGERLECVRQGQAKKEKTRNCRSTLSPPCGSGLHPMTRGPPALALTGINISTRRQPGNHKDQVSHRMSTVILQLALHAAHASTSPLSSDGTRLSVRDPSWGR